MLYPGALGAVEHLQPVPGERQPSEYQQSTYHYLMSKYVGRDKALEVMLEGEQYDEIRNNSDFLSDFTQSELNLLCGAHEKLLSLQQAQGQVSELAPASKPSNLIEHLIGGKVYYGNQDALKGIFRMLL